MDRCRGINRVRFPPNPNTMKIRIFFGLIVATLVSFPLQAAILGPGDGSDEPGFVSPPADALKPKNS